MNYAKKAIIMAAGKGNRLHPVTLDTPKPLVKVNGVRMIDTIINALHVNGINEIYVVVGYLREQFYCLKEEYAGIHIVENPLFDSCNNISSLYVVRDKIGDTIIIDGDQIINNDDILYPEFEKSGYNAVWTDEPTNEWLMTVTNGSVASCSREGGKNGWQLFGISRWTHDDGIKIRRQLEIEFIDKQNRQIYWDDIPMFCYFEEYDLGIYPMKKEDVIEIDNYSELIAIDATYTDYEPINGDVEDE